MTTPFSLTPLKQYIDDQNEPICAYYYDLDYLSERIQWITRELPEQVNFYYAIKANSDKPVLRTLAPYVYGFEVASLGEINKVRQATPDKPIAFGGPGKTSVELQGALESNVELYHIESELQLIRLNTLAKDAGKPVKVLLRINPYFSLPNATLQMAGKPTQFGVDQHQIESILKSLGNYSNISCVGFHFHALSNNLDAKSHLLLIQNYIELAQMWQRAFGFEIELINVGGGIGFNYEPHGSQFDWELYCDGLTLIFEQSGIEFKLAMECGRFVTAPIGCYVAEVTDLKTNHGENFAILRGGSHHFRLPSSWQHNHPFKIVPKEQWNWPCSRPGFNQENITLCGELCTPKDVLGKQVHVEQVRVGDLVLFEHAGAYGWHISHHDFLSHPHPERIYIQNNQLTFPKEY
ncbi:type III PLP-dependent enzyme [Marinomonas sp. UCMA 3892]|uniref:type III PLP-dependent enzyme n=1 Tax=unclassified Marinomonas TaxID=196814 RepID=UPI000C1F4C29|nr:MULTISPECIES: type III PLP-dependent enzyme [unclassified Marinomonas]NLU99020.1 type III PLP-dependent enzyme [Marinomonas sp. UCMA 3892]PJE53606.1 diaminopimelate decarboxylase [Marinomonas sp. BSi20584]